MSLGSNSKHRTKNRSCKRLKTRRLMVFWAQVLHEVGALLCTCDWFTVGLVAISNSASVRGSDPVVRSEGPRQTHRGYSLMHSFIRQSKISALSSLGQCSHSPVFSRRKGFPYHLNNFIQPQSQTSQNTHGDWYILGYMVGS